MQDRTASGATITPQATPPDPDLPAQPISWVAFEHASWWRQLQRASRSVLLLDYDGTLAPFVLDRMRAWPYRGVPQRLLRLAITPRTRLVLISGRPAAELASLLPEELHVEIWGSHGREQLLPDGSHRTTPLSPSQQSTLDELELTLRQKDLAPLIEKKIGSLAVHTRGLSAAKAAGVLSFVRRFYGDLQQEGRPAPAELEWLPFDGGIELRGSGCSKATAVHSILADEPSQAPAAYLGDDRTDEDAFMALQKEGSPHDGGRPTLPVLVRPERRPTAAALWLTPPEQLLAFLDRWLEAVVHTEDPL